MSCTNCYNGCVETISDECVRYTGLAIPELNIQPGDTLVHVEQMITDKLVPLLTGTGDVITISSHDLCPLIEGFLIGITDPNTTQLFTAVIQSICTLQSEIDALDSTVGGIESNYTVGCLTGVTAGSGTHAILQAVIAKLCVVAADLAAFKLNVPLTYVKIADLNALIAAYIASQTGNITQQYLKMVPYTAVEYYGPLTNFDGTGAGISTLGWDKVYLCNGLNGTPDKRGRVTVGAIKNVPGGPLNPAVDPVFIGNPNYAVRDIAGVNAVTLLTSQLPSHTHIATATANSTVSDPGHFHYSGHSPKGWSSSGTIGVTDEVPQTNKTTDATTGITVTTTVGVTNSSAGGGASHNNIQPSLAAYYIMYIP